MPELKVDPGLVARCGLYCGACGSYQKGRCPGCHDNTKATWCKVRHCCDERSFATCADCQEHSDPNHCRHFNNFFSKVMAVFFNSNRQACILKIRELGVDDYAAFMAERGLQRLPRRGPAPK